jgi:hypothetical protein
LGGEAGWGAELKIRHADFVTGKLQGEKRSRQGKNPLARVRRKINPTQLLPIET